jgi:Tfp pilus assembly protein PilF
MSKDINGIADVLQRDPAAINQKSPYDQTALHIAAQLGSVDMCSLLLSHSANTNAKDKIGLTPLHTACLCDGEHDADDREMVCMLLLSHGAELDALDIDGNTPMHLAVEANATVLAVHFLKRGARFDIPNAVGITAHQLAALHMRTDIIQALIGFGASAISEEEITACAYRYYYEGTKRRLVAGDTKTASALIEEANEMFPSRPELMELRALTNTKLGNLELAKRDYENAYETGAASVAGLVGYARLLQAVPFSDYTGAERLLLEAIAIGFESDSHNADVLADLGFVYEIMKRSGQAKQMYTKALALNPQHQCSNKIIGIDCNNAIRDRDVPALDRIIDRMREFKPSGVSFQDLALQIAIEGLVYTKEQMLKGEVFFPCEKCGTHAKLKCGRCNITRYCSKICQTAHWKGHKPVCGQPRVPDRPHNGTWGCPDCGVMCTCEEIPHDLSCVHAICNKSQRGAVCPGLTSCIWLNCCESSSKVGLCNSDQKTAKVSHRLLKYNLSIREFCTSMGIS